MATIASPAVDHYKFYFGTSFPPNPNTQAKISGLTSSLVAPPAPKAARLDTTRKDGEALVVYKQAALAFANEQRVANYLQPLAELPKGIKGNSCECVLAKALPIVDDKPAKANPSFVYVGGLTVTVPDAVGGFITSFDDGQYPDLELATL